MRITCPQCQGVVVFVDKQTAKCQTHGGTFSVLFSRAFPDHLENPVTKESLPGMCANHPQVASISSCHYCQTALCKTCEMPMSAGNVACADCAVSHAQGGTARVLAGVKCGQHPEIQAVDTCRSCNLGVCATCDFSFAGNIHLCPRCVSQQPKTGLSASAKKSLVGAYLLGMVSMVGMFVGLVIAVGAQTKEGQEGAGVLMSLFGLFPALGGFGLAFSAYESGQSNSAWTWGGIICNGLILGLFLLLTIIGTFS